MRPESMRRTVGIAEMRVSSRPEEVLITYALGSCLGIALYDPVARVGGLLHAMLPTSTPHPEKARSRPETFVDTGVPLLFHACYRAGAVKERIVVKVAGGASACPDEEADSFRIGRHNLLMLHRLFRKNGVLIQAQDVGGSLSRTMSLDIATGEVLIRSNGTSRGL